MSYVEGQQQLFDYIHHVEMQEDSWRNIRGQCLTSIRASTLEVPIKKEISTLLMCVKPPTEYIDTASQQALSKTYDKENPGLHEIVRIKILLSTMLTKYMPSLPKDAYAYIQTLISQYDDFIRILADTDADVKRQLLARKVSLFIVAQGFYLVHQDQARVLASISADGRTIKTIASGGRAVTAHKGVHYKSGRNRIPLQPAFQEAASSLLRLFAGTKRITALSTFMVMKDLSIATSSPSSSTSSSFSSVSLLDTDKNVMIQASLSIEGVSFHDVLMLQYLFNHVKTRLTISDEANILNFMNKMLSPDYFYEQASSIINESLVDLALESDDDKSKYKTLFLAYKKIFPSLRENEFIGFYQSQDEHYLITMLGVFNCYPELAQTMECKDIILLYKSFHEIMPKLFPSNTVTIAHAQIPDLINILDGEAASALHIGLILSLPKDARFVNFMFVPEYDSNGYIIQSTLVAFDNDESLTAPISTSKDTIEINIRNELFLLKAWMDLALHPNVIDRVLTKDPMTWMLVWLIQLGEQYQVYQHMFDSGALDAEDLVDPHGGEPIHIPFIIQSGVLNYIYSLIREMHSYLHALKRENKTCTHADLFKVLQPDIDMLYRYLASKGEGVMHAPMHVNAIQEILESVACKSIQFDQIPKAVTDWKSFLTTKPCLKGDMIDASERLMYAERLQRLAKLEDQPAIPIDEAVQMFIKGVQIRKETVWQPLDTLFGLFPKLDASWYLSSSQRDALLMQWKSQHFNHLVKALQDVYTLTSSSHSAGLYDPPLVPRQVPSDSPARHTGFRVRSSSLYEPKPKPQDSELPPNAGKKKFLFRF